MNDEYLTSYVLKVSLQHPYTSTSTQFHNFLEQHIYKITCEQYTAMAASLCKLSFPLTQYHYGSSQGNIKVLLNMSIPGELNSKLNWPI